LKEIIGSLLVEKSGVSFSDIAGLEVVKASLFESIILPNLRPDIFTGIRAPHRGTSTFVYVYRHSPAWSTWEWEDPFGEGSCDRI
jgi:hypothetical protein